MPTLNPSIPPRTLLHLCANSRLETDLLPSPRKKWIAGLAATVLLATVAAGRADEYQRVAIGASKAGATPFISQVAVAVDNLGALDSYSFTIQPKPGSATRPIAAKYAASYLTTRGFLSLTDNTLTVPVWGLYADYANTVKMEFTFVNGRTEEHTASIQTAAFNNPVFTPIKTKLPRVAGTNLSYDFILLKNYLDAASPTILDTDGLVRWIGVSSVGSQNSALYKNGVYIAYGTSLLRMEFDGEITGQKDFAPQVGVTDFHHNIDFGREGLICDVDTATNTESLLMEVGYDGDVLHTWDFADIVSKAMIAGGDDPTQFVHPAPVDWFHTNCATYRPSDNSLIVSSRENFVIAVDYDSKAIKWVFGDPAKYWHQFPSLAKYQLSYPSTTKPPIGQHAVSIDQDHLLLFDDGYASLNQPAVAPIGKNRKYSAGRMYAIDSTANSAAEIFTYTDDKKIYSPICSSIYADAENNYLLDYSTGGPFKFLELVGLDDTGGKAFEYRFTEPSFCGTGWNAVPIHLENLTFQ